MIWKFQEILPSLKQKNKFAPENGGSWKIRSFHFGATFGSIFRGKLSSFGGFFLERNS